MAQRDYEEQPEAPDLGASVQLESDQHLAAPPGDRNGLDAGYVPADRPYALDEDGVTARGMREGDTLDERLARERTDEPSDPDRAGRLTAADGGSALESPDDMEAVDVGIDGGAASAEEAAVHVSEDPAAMSETEPSVAGSIALDDPEVDAAGDPLAGAAASGLTPDGGDLTGREPDPAWPQDPGDTDPARRGLGDAAADIDAAREAGGSAAPASGRQDAGPGVWR
jgi:Family of unknown function (DUF5709)